MNAPGLRSLSPLTGEKCLVQCKCLRARESLAFAPLVSRTKSKRKHVVRVCAKLDTTREELRTNSKTWFEQLPLVAKAGVTSAAVSMTVAQTAFAENVDLDAIGISEVLPGVVFSLGMVVTGYYFAGSHHEEAEKKVGKQVCYTTDGDGDDGQPTYACEIREPEVDLYRDTAVRYLGYSNECGEAFRPLIGDLWANLTYVIAISYVLADARDKGIKAKQGSGIARAAEVFKRLDTTGDGYLTFDQVRTAFRELRVPLTLEQVREYFNKADVYKNNILTFDEWMWSFDSADAEMQMLMNAGAQTIRAEDVVPNAVLGLKLHSNMALEEAKMARAQLRAASEALTRPTQDAQALAEAQASVKEASLRLDRIEEEIGAQAESVERISALRYNWGTGKKETTVLAAVASADALVWQMTASVMMPGFTINRIVTLTALLVQQYHVGAGTALESVAPFIPTVVGLAVIPFIVTPLDVLADVLLNATVRPLVFASIDADKTGKITEAELIEKLGNRAEYLPREAILELFAEMDADKDGVISMEEWANGGFKLYKKYLARSGSIEETAVVN
eukprot:CAMPEP_0198201134 /NCGR_PEP_ID=MMETSP1445-20131203/3925_1 /TAXON_ID=36898 /ORGANISM="Pyramimonas sp., Strain CCMP2087" /LENGTH=562 /DNA_ID=CAMNT_0043871329 /DNA_START=137 /DNA_END=1825 /DNA_ORIENTATION=+